MSSCAFCEELVTRECGELGDRTIWENDDWMVIPTVGCFVEGYVMLMPKDHTYSFGQLDSDLLSLAASRLVEKLRIQLSQIYNKQIFVAEHGAVSCAVKGAQCCDHAHLHFIPIGNDAHMDCLDRIYSSHSNNISPKVLDNLDQLADFAGYPYVLGSFNPWLYHVHFEELSGFRSQFCRWAAARVLGIEKEYNWKTHPCWDNMRRTISTLRGKLKL